MLLVVAAVAVAFGGASRHAAGNGENGAVAAAAAFGGASGHAAGNGENGAVVAAAFGGASGHAACNLKPSKGRRH